MRSLTLDCYTANWEDDGDDGSLSDRDLPRRHLLRLGLGPATRNKIYLRQLAEQAKREYAASSIAEEAADKASLLSAGAGSA